MIVRVQDYHRLLDKLQRLRSSSRLSRSILFNYITSWLLICSRWAHSFSREWPGQGWETFCCQTYRWGTCHISTTSFHFSPLNSQRVGSCGRVVKVIDLKSIESFLRRFESCRLRFYQELCVVKHAWKNIAVPLSTIKAQWYSPTVDSSLWSTKGLSGFIKSSETDHFCWTLKMWYKQELHNIYISIWYLNCVMAINVCSKDRATVAE